MILSKLSQLLWFIQNHLNQNFLTPYHQLTLIANSTPGTLQVYTAPSLTQAISVFSQQNNVSFKQNDIVYDIGTQNLWLCISPSPNAQFIIGNDLPAWLHTTAIQSTSVSYWAVATPPTPPTPTPPTPTPPTPTPPTPIPAVTTTVDITAIYSDLPQLVSNVTISSRMKALVNGSALVVTLRNESDTLLSFGLRCLAGITADFSSLQGSFARTSSSLDADGLPEGNVSSKLLFNNVVPGASGAITHQLFNQVASTISLPAASTVDLVFKFSASLAGVLGANATTFYITNTTNFEDVESADNDTSVVLRTQDVSIYNLQWFNESYQDPWGVQYNDYNTSCGLKFSMRNNSGYPAKFMLKMQAGGSNNDLTPDQNGKNWPWHYSDPNFKVFYPNGTEFSAGQLDFDTSSADLYNALTTTGVVFQLPASFDGELGFIRFNRSQRQVVDEHNTLTLSIVNPEFIDLSTSDNQRSLVSNPPPPPVKFDNSFKVTLSSYGEYYAKNTLPANFFAQREADVDYYVVNSSAAAWKFGIESSSLDLSRLDDGDVIVVQFVIPEPSNIDDAQLLAQQVNYSDYITVPMDVQSVTHLQTPAGEDTLASNQYWTQSRAALGIPSDINLVSVTAVLKPDFAALRANGGKFWCFLHIAFDASDMTNLITEGHNKFRCVVNGIGVFNSAGVDQANLKYLQTNFAFFSSNIKFISN